MSILHQIIQAARQDMKAILYIRQDTYRKILEETDGMLFCIPDQKYTVAGLRTYIINCSSHPAAVLYTAHGMQTILGETS
jgi:hypothetical protein